MMRIIKQLFLFIIAFVSTMALSEVFIRNVHLANTSSTEFYEDIGRGRRKNLKYLYFNEGFGIGNFNKHRYIGGYEPINIPDNTVKIALLGDSYIEAFQIFERDHFGNTAENILSKATNNQKIEFLNFGRSGFDISDIYAYHNTFAKKFDPDLILYFVSKKDLTPRKTDPLRPQTIIKNDSLIISFEFDQKDINTFNNTKFLTQNLSIFHMLNNGRKKTKVTPTFYILLDKIYTWFNPTVKTKSKQNENNSEYKLHPITLKIVENTNPNKVIIINRDNSELPKEFKNLCIKNGFNYIDLSNVLKKMIVSGVDPYEWNITKKRGHWNHSTHKEIGKELAKQLAPILINKNLIPKN